MKELRKQEEMEKPGGRDRDVLRPSPLEPVVQNLVMLLQEKQSKEIPIRCK